MVGDPPQYKHLHCTKSACGWPFVMMTQKHYPQKLLLPKAKHGNISPFNPYLPSKKGSAQVTPTADTHSTVLQCRANVYPAEFARLLQRQQPAKHTTQLVRQQPTQPLDKPMHVIIAILPPRPMDGTCPEHSLLVRPPLLQQTPCLGPIPSVGGMALLLPMPESTLSEGRTSRAPA